MFDLLKIGLEVLNGKHDQEIMKSLIEQQMNQGNNMPPNNISQVQDYFQHQRDVQSMNDMMDKLL